MSRVPWLCLLVAITLISGCGRSNRATVTGKVVFPDGSPLTSGHVVFSPADENLRAAAQGTIDGEGKFRLGTQSGGDGVAPGKYLVAIEPDDRAGRAFDPRFESTKTSRLEFTVVPGSNDFTITLEKPAKKKKK